MVNIVIDSQNQNDPAYVASTGAKPLDVTCFPSEEADPILQEYYDQVNGFCEASEQVQVLEELREVLRGAEEIDPQSVKIANIVIENFRKRFNIPVKTVAVESMGDKEAVLEGIGGVITAVFNAIMDTLKAIFKSIGGLFSTTQAEKAEKEINDLKQDIKENKAKYSAKNPTMTTPLLNVLDFDEGGDITVNDLVRRVERKHADLLKMHESNKGLRDLSDKTIKSMKKLMNDPVSAETLEQFENEVVMDFRDFQYHGYSRMHSGLDKDKYSESISRFEERHGIKDQKRKKYSYLTPYYDETVVVRCEVIDDAISYYHGILTKNKSVHEIKIEIPTMETFGDFVEDYAREVESMAATMKKTASVLKNTGIDEVLKLIPDFIAFTEKNYPSKASHLVKPFRAYANSMRENAHAARFVQKSSEDFHKLVVFIRTCYQEIVVI